MRTLHRPKLPSSSLITDIQRQFWIELAIGLFWRTIYAPSSLWKWWRAPHTIHISKTKIIIGAYIFWTLLPISNKNHIVYGDPISPVPQITIHKPLKALPQTTLSNAEAVEPVKTASVVTYTAPVQVSYSGSHTDWMAQAGIASSDYTYVDYIISHESGWDPTNWYGKGQGLPYNPASSAAGLPQALPYAKTNCAWGDPICQLIWANNYATKYGGWYGSYLHWMANHNW